MIIFACCFYKGSRSLCWGVHAAAHRHSPHSRHKYLFSVLEGQRVSFGAPVSASVAACCSLLLLLLLLQLLLLQPLLLQLLLLQLLLLLLLAQ